LGFILLKENNNWEIDLEEVESLIDDQTVSIIVNNPSNPCGSVYSRDHLVKVIQLAEKYKLPIIAGKNRLVSKYEPLHLADR
jgi:tyrosine aminotransferase